MERDVLFLLKERFEDGPGKHWYCRHCAELTGVMAYYPELRHHLDVRYVDFPRPRGMIVELIGPENQGCPVLVLANKPAEDVLPFVSGHNHGRYFVSGPEAIARYWSKTRGIPAPH